MSSMNCHKGKYSCNAFDVIFSDLTAERDALKEDLRLSRITIKADDAEISRLEAEAARSQKDLNYSLDKMWTDRDRYRSLAEKAREYVVHEQSCILSFWEAGEPTENGGYRTKYKGKWYQSKPINKEPKCGCGLADILSAFPAEGMKGGSRE